MEPQEEEEDEDEAANDDDDDDNAAAGDDNDDDAHAKDESTSAGRPKKAAKRNDGDEDDVEELEGLSGDEVDQSNIIKGGRAARRGRPNHLANANRSSEPETKSGSSAPQPKKPGEDSDED